MADQWYYTQGGQVRGPISTDRVRQLLATAELKADEEIWADTAERGKATVVRKAAELAPAAPKAAVPDWLGDVAKAEEAARQKSAAPTELDWLADVEIPVGPLEPAPPPLPAAPTVDVVPVEALPGKPPPVVTVEPLTLLPPAPRASGPLRLLVGGATSRGMVRDHNEDHFVIQQMVWSDGEDGHELALLVVCDGMGGHKGGARASSLAARSIATTMAPVLAGLLQNPSRDAGAAVLARNLDKAFQDAHAAICRRAEAEPALKGMGCTTAVVLVWDDQAFLRHIGDCRIYYKEGKDFQQVTKDQTLVARMIELGQLTPAEAEKHPSRGEVTQALGKRGVVEPSQESLLLEEGDRLVLACDGLGAHVDAATLAETVIGWQGSAHDLAARLVDMANEGGGTDNCTVLTLFCG
jgi:protein phosphatase